MPAAPKLLDPRPLELTLRHRVVLTPLVTRLTLDGEVVRAVGGWLASRGFPAQDISPKASWRAGRANAAHGEPLRDA